MVYVCKGRSFGVGCRGGAGDGGGGGGGGGGVGGELGKYQLQEHQWNMFHPGETCVLSPTPVDFVLQTLRFSLTPEARLSSESIAVSLVVAGLGSGRSPPLVLRTPGVCLCVCCCRDSYCRLYTAHPRMKCDCVCVVVVGILVVGYEPLCGIRACSGGTLPSRAFSPSASHACALLDPLRRFLCALHPTPPTSPLPLPPPLNIHIMI